MAPQPSTAVERAAPTGTGSEDRLLERLLGLYAEEAELYRRIEELSRRQLALLRAGAELGEIGDLLGEKKACLETIGRLELTERHSKDVWRRERDRWRPAARLRLHRALNEVSGLIDEIIGLEQRCDDELLQQARGAAWTRS
jgi:hypothetical protein